MEGRDELGLEGVTGEFGQRELGDFQGMAPANLNLLASLRQGKYKNHLQWDTMHKTTSAYSNFYEASGRTPLGATKVNGEKNCTR